VCCLLFAIDDFLSCLKDFLILKSRKVASDLIALKMMIPPFIYYLGWIPSFEFHYGWRWPYLQC
jgi:ABC-type Fe3+ transport system permease subunit